MARPRITKQPDNQTPKKRKGFSNVYITVRQGANGPYNEYRQPYWTTVPVSVGGEVVGWERKRRAASSSLSAEEAIAKADKAKREGHEAEEAWWRIQRGEKAPSLEAPAQQPSRSLSMIECSQELMASRRRYVDKRLEGHRHSYKKKQQNYLNHLSDSGLAERPMNTLRLVEISAWFIRFMEGHAETTSARFRSWLVTLGAWAQDNGYWQANLFVRLPELSASVSEESKRVYTWDEIDAMWGAANTPQQKAMLVLLRVGLRQGEVLAMDEDFVGETHVEVAYTLGEHENVWRDKSVRGAITKNVPFLGRPKTPSSQAKIHVPSVWMEHVRAALESARWSGVRAYTDATEDDTITRKFVVSNRYGLVWEEGSASAAMRNLMVRAGIKVVDNESTFHAWRHTFCSDLVALGANDIELASVMRHRDANLSKTVYASARKDQLKEYRRYAESIDRLTDYIDAICKMDEERRAKKRKAKAKAA